MKTAIIFLLACWAATFLSASLAARVEPAAAPVERDQQQQVSPGLVIVPRVFGGSGGDADPELLRCVTSLIKTEGCVVRLVESLFSGKISLTEECCLAIASMSEHCFSSIFAVPVFGSVFPGLVRSFCAAIDP